jgi:2-phospho-L-lactate guanylyltransferase
MPLTAAPDWRLVIPVKGTAAAKSRLRPPSGTTRVALAEAMAQDSTAAAAQGMPGVPVFVVAGDARVAEWAPMLGAHVVPDPGGGLNAAVTAGVAAAHHADGPSPVGVAVLLADVPALRPGDLAAALGAATAYDLAFVPDADGSGTVLLTSLDGHSLHPSFGPGSASRHEQAGHHRLDLALPSLRTDVDDAAALARAAALGLGPRTAALLAWPRRATG